MRHAPLPPLARAAALGLGLLVAAAIVLAGRTDRTDAVASAAAVTVSLQVPGELERRDRGPLAAAASLRPGGRTRWSATVRNQTGSPLVLAVRAMPSQPDLDRLLRVAVTSGEGTIASGTLGDLRTARRDAAPLPAGATRTLAVDAWLPRDVPSGWQARVVDVPIDLTARGTGGSR